MSIFKPKNFKEQLLHDAGHALTAVIVIIVLSILGVGMTWAFILGCFGSAAVMEAIDYVNVGTGDCTGTGVKIYDTVDTHLVGPGRVMADGL